MRKIFLTTNLMLLLCLMATAVCAQQIIRVKHNAPSGGDGSSWANAYQTLQQGIDAAAAIVVLDSEAITPQIWVAGGPYLPTVIPTASNTPVPANGNSDKTFYISNRVELYGGFVGANDNESLAGRTLKTTLSGDLNNSGDGNIGDAYHVMIITNAGDVVLDGFTFREGYATTTATTQPSYGGTVSRRDHGGGLMINNGASNNLTVKNCVFTGNTGGESGGARVQNSSTVVFSDCLFLDNKATSAGAAISVTTGANVTIDHTRFLNNSSISTTTSATGALYVNGASVGATVNINNSLFYGNKGTSTAGGAGAIRLANYTNVTISGTTIYGNEIAGNATNNNGGAGIHFLTPTATTQFKLYNSIIYGNIVGAGTGPADIDGTLPAAFEVKNTITQVYTTSDNTANKVQVGINPLFINTADTENTDFLRLPANSLARRAGDLTFVSGTLDLAGNSRTLGGIDLGAYQSATTLPVELENFDVKKVVNGAQLTWKVLSETNNANFVIERSSTDGQNFTVIAVTPSKGNTNQVAAYTHKDNTPLNGKNYYRLSQTDKDGVSKVLGVREVNFDLSVAGIQVYPNPVRDVVRVKVGTVQNSGAKVSLYSLAGTELLLQKINKTEAEQGFDLDVRSFNSGTYILVVDSGNKVIDKAKVIIVR